MKKPSTPRKINGIGDAAVQAKTGRTWAEWCAVLDKVGAAKWGHKEIAAYIHDKRGCSGWWSQMVTVGYEQERGLRERHEKPNGYTAGVSRTVAAPLADLFAAWAEARRRSKWLKDAQYTIRGTTANKSVRIRWSDETPVVVQFYAKGKGKSQVTVQHDKLPGQRDVTRMKTYWGKALDRLKEELEA